MNRLLIEGATLVGLTSAADVRPDTDLYAEEGRLRATGPEARRLAEESERGGAAVERLDARGRWALPGFVQAHLHLCQTLLRNGPEN
ncbi:MAG TPA: hypothetical protein VFW81_01750, partial [Thermoanaerobaculia bacterium]|nr:hypothetical protein [Thermoanaerobaculia bacterium]